MSTETFRNGSNASDQALINLAKFGGKVDPEKLAKAQAAVAESTNVHPLVGRKGYVVKGCAYFGVWTRQSFTVVAVRPEERQIVIAVGGRRLSFRVAHINRTAEPEFNLSDSNGKIRVSLI